MELIAVLLCLFTAAAVILDKPEPVRRDIDVAGDLHEAGLVARE